MNKNFISEIEAINFQSHSYTHLELSPGVNVFKGDSHSGKSSIMRLLEWIFFNEIQKLRGDGFRSHFAKKNEDTKGTVVFSEGTYVTRRKGKKNSYLSEDLSLDAVRSDVPDEIKEITQISRINFQSQGDRHYLLEDSPGIVGKKLNDIVGLGIIDDTKKTINNIINETSLRLKINGEDIEETEQELIKYDGLDKVEKIINRVTKAIDKSQEKKVRHDKIEFIVNKIKPLQAGLVKLINWMKIEEGYFKLEIKLAELNNQKQVYSKIDFLYGAIKNNERELKKLKEWITIEDDYNKLIKKYEACAERRFKHDKISDIYDDIQKAEKSVESLRDLLIVKKKRQFELQKSLAYCQYCGADKKYWRER